MTTNRRQIPALLRSHDLHEQTPIRRQSKRSPSPRVFKTPSPHPTDSGVKNITLKVIRKLEGLGHLEDMIDEQNESDEKEEREEGEVESFLQPNGHSPQAAARPDALTNGSTTHAKKEIDWEIPRKVLHSSIGFVTIYLYVSQGSPKIVVYSLWSALAIIAPADYLRLRYPPFERVYEKLLGFLMRESEKHHTNGVIWYIIGVNFALTFYPLDVATVAILILSWADTAASTIGRLWGPHTPRLPSRTPLLRLPLAPRKSLAGFLAASVTGACIAMGFWGKIAPIRPEGVTWKWQTGVNGVFGGWFGLVVIGAISGLVSGVAEALDLGSLDDNLTLPIISGGCLLGFLKLLSVFAGI